MKTQINAKLITRIFGTALIVGLAGKGVAASPSTETRSAVVKIADLNLDSPQGVAALYKRIHSAAEQVCAEPTEDRVFFEVAAQVKQCERQAEARAIKSVHNVALEAYYSKKTGQPMPVVLASK